MWVEYTHNPRAITHLYKDVPPLLGVEVTAIRLDPRGPTIHCALDLPRFADIRPPRWSKEFNTVAVEIDFSGIRNLRISDLVTIPILNFAISKLESGLSVEATGSGMSMSFHCDSIYIQTVTGYCNTEREPAASS